MIEARVECGVEQRFGVLLLVKNAPMQRGNIKGRS